MRKLLKYLKPYKTECICAPLFKMLEAIFELFVPLVVAGIIDTGIGHGERNYIIRCCLIMVLLGIVGLISAISAQYFAAKAAVGFSTSVRHDLFSHIMSLSYKNIDDSGVSTLITRITSDINQTQTGVNMFLRLFLRSPFIVFGAMIMAFTIDPKEALIFVGVIVILFIIVGGVMYFNIPMLKRVQKRLDVITLLTRENLTGVRVIRAFQMEEKEIDSYLDNNSELVNMQLRAGHLSAALNPMTYIVVNMALVMLIYVGAIRVDSGVISQGMVVALYNYMSQILVELIKLANLIVLLNKAIASGDRIAEVMDITPDIAQDKCNAENNSDGQLIRSSADIAVEFDGVSLKYNANGDDAISDITFRAKTGETIGIIGGTGSGKSSVVNLIPRFYDAYKGAVKVYGQDVKNINVSILRSNIGIVPQKAVLFKGTIADNLKVGYENATETEMLDAVRLAMAEDVVAAKGGLDGLIEQNGRNLSGGQKQRLTIARALVRKPQILILDDSSSALDYATELKLRKGLLNLDYNPTVIIVSQRASSVQNADRIIVLDDGNVVGQGQHDELYRDCSVYKEIYDSQFSE